MYSATRQEVAPFWNFTTGISIFLLSLGYIYVFLGLFDDKTGISYLFLLMLIQLNLWFGHQSLTPGQEVILKAEVDEDLSLLDTEFIIESSSGLVIENLPIRIEEKREVDWQLRAKKAGIHELSMTVNGHRIVKKVAVAQKPLSKISSVKVRRNFIDELFHPGEAPLPRSHPIKSLEITYPLNHMSLFGWKIHWLIVYFALSIIFGFAFKGVFKVEI